MNALSVRFLDDLPKLTIPIRGPIVGPLEDIVVNMDAVDEATPKTRLLLRVERPKRHITLAREDGKFMQVYDFAEEGRARKDTRAFVDPIAHLALQKTTSGLWQIGPEQVRPYNLDTLESFLGIIASRAYDKAALLEQPDKQVNVWAESTVELNNDGY